MKEKNEMMQEISKMIRNLNYPSIGYKVNDEDILEVLKDALEYIDNSTEYNDDNLSEDDEKDDISVELSNIEDNIEHINKLVHDISKEVDSYGVKEDLENGLESYYFDIWEELDKMTDSIDNIKFEMNF